MRDDRGCRGAFGRIHLGHPRLDCPARVRQARGVVSLPARLGCSHVAALALVLDERDVLDRCVEAMAGFAHETGRDIEHRVVTAFRCYAAGDMRACVVALERDRECHWEAIGGSNEERALIAKLHARASAQLEPDVVTGLARMLRAPLVACLALACTLSTASCVGSRSSETSRASSRQTHELHRLGIGTCSDDIEETPSSACAPLSQAPTTVPPPPSAGVGQALRCAPRSRRREPRRHQTRARARLV